MSTAVLPPFFRYLTEKVKSIHYGDLQPTPVEEIEGTHDPRTGTAYYFTASGNQLRKMPQYEKNLKDNKNREPRRDQDCRKVYPTVSHGGYSYILLWFCPIHSWAFLQIPYYRWCGGTQRCLLFPIKIQRGYATRAVL